MSVYEWDRNSKKFTKFIDHAGQNDVQIETVRILFPYF